MELDLDSFLDSHLSSDSEDESTSYPHRTVDEILNDSDSSSSPSSSPSFPSINQFNSNSNNHLARSSSVPSESTPSVRGNETGTTLANPETLKSPQLESRASALTRVGDPLWKNSSSSASSSSSSSLRQLPSLFGGVRSSAKPGAALAAAAAASRSIPTPYAAALKSRRAGSGSLLKVVRREEFGSSVRVVPILPGPSSTQQ